MSNVNSERINALREIMKSKNLDCYIVFTADEHLSEYIDEHYKFRKYLSGFTGSAGTVLVTDTQAILWTDGRYFIQAANQLEGTGVELYKMAEPGVKTIDEFLKDKVNKQVDIYRIGVDFKTLSLSTYEMLNDLNKEKCELVNVDLADLVWTDRPAETRNGYRILPVKLSGRCVKDKLEEVRGKLKADKNDGIIITDLSDVCWLFNIRGNDIRYNPVCLSYGYVSMDEAFLFVVNSEDDGEKVSLLEAEGVVVKAYDDFDEFISGIKGKKIVCDPEAVNAHVFNALKGNTVVKEDAYKYISKHIKNDTECRLARDWHIKDGLAVTKYIYKIKNIVKTEKITEYQAGSIMDELRYEIDGNLGLSFDTICAYGANGAIVHYSANEDSSILQNEGFLLLDSGGQYDGATTDITRTIALGQLTEEMKICYTAVLKGVLDLADAVFLEGCRAENLDILARRPIWDLRIDYKHGTGHGIGAFLNVHEGPQSIRYKINNKKPQPQLAAGMVTSDEPGIYLGGKFGIRVENELICVNKEKNEWGNFLGFDTITLVPYERDAIVETMLTKREVQILNDYNKLIYDTYCNDLSEDERVWLKKVTCPIE